jgi:hypothetical protein
MLDAGCWGSGASIEEEHAFEIANDISIGIAGWLCHQPSLLSGKECFF